MTKRKITLRSKIGLCLFMCPNVILVSVAYMDVLALLCFIKPAFSLQHSLVNTPPILYVPERNWRISESEQVGQIITRIRAEDPENDDLIFGLEPHFISNYSEENDKHNLPFRIDEVRGNVYLNESLIGRGGENFFLYITVSDGDLTAKNEVFVNILAKDSHMVTNFRTPPSVTSVVQNFSQILPQFNTLLGTQHSNERPINHLPSKFGLNQYMSSHNHHSASNELEIDTSEQTTPLMSTATTNMPPSTTGRIRLKAIIKADNNASVNGLRENIYNYSNDSVLMADSKEKPLQTEINARPVENNKKNKYPYIDPADENASNLISIKAVIIPVIAISCGLFFAAAGFFGFLYRKHLCAFSKKLKKKSKEEITKKSNHSNLSCDLTDGSQNSMVLQHWNGPIAYHNRYVPQQLQNALVTSQLTANSMDRRAIHNTDPGNLSGIQNSSNTIAGETQTGMNMNIGYRSVVESKVDRVICRWEFPRHRLKFFNILGEGAFGQVWRCETIDVD
ncbi:tyrosine kinase receptor Cad96Ca-like, partial [Rhagoletis pomonella]